MALAEAIIVVLGPWSGAQAAVAGVLRADLMAGR
jgi:hypothetical protein